VDDRFEPRFAETDRRLAPFARAAAAFAECVDWPPVETWSERLAAIGIELPVTFVVQAYPIRRRPGERAPYDRAIASEGRVPSRERSWHDFLNMLAWAAFPRTKAAIHARHLEAAEMREGDASGNRGRERDALAMIDEGGVLVAAADARLAREALALDGSQFAALRSRGAATPLLFGHALAEHLVRARSDAGIHAAVLVVAAGPGDVDGAAAEAIADATTPWTPERLARAPLGWI